MIAPSRRRARVKPPGPGPTSIVVPDKVPEERAICRVRERSKENFVQVICVPAYPSIQQAGAKGARLEYGLLNLAVQPSSIWFLLL